MIYLANPSTAQVRAAMSAGLIACMTTPAQGNRVPAGAWWAADNGVFGKGYPGDARWLAWLASRTADPDRCLFVTAPDVVGNAAETLERSRPFLPQIRALGYPAALVAQDGLEVLEVPWSEFDVLFIGGSTEWKLGEHARHLAAEARARGKRVHVGRVNSRKRFELARDAFGADSADGTFLAFGPDLLLPELLSWAHPVIPGHSWRAHRHGRPCGNCPEGRNHMSGADCILEHPHPGQHCRPRRDVYRNRWGGAPTRPPVEVPDGQLELDVPGEAPPA